MSSPKYDNLAQELIQKGEWKEHKDKKTGKTYFSNVETKKVVWNLSAHLAKLDIKKSSSSPSSAFASPTSQQYPAGTNTPTSVTLSSVAAASPAPQLPHQQQKHQEDQPGNRNDNTHKQQSNSSSLLNNNNAATSSRITEENLKKQQNQLHDHNGDEQHQEEEGEEKHRNDHHHQEEMVSDNKNTTTTKTSTIIRQRRSPPNIQIQEIEVQQGEEEPSSSDGNINNNNHHDDNNHLLSVPSHQQRTAQSAHSSPQYPKTNNRTIGDNNNNDAFSGQEQYSSTKPGPSFTTVTSPQQQPRYEEVHHDTDYYFNHSDNGSPSPPTSPIATKMAEKYLRDYDKNKNKREERKSSPENRKSELFKTTSFDAMRTSMSKRADQQLNQSQSQQGYINYRSSLIQQQQQTNNTNKTQNSIASKKYQQEISQYRDQMKELRRQLMNYRLPASSTNNNSNNNRHQIKPLPWQRFLGASTSLASGLNEKMAQCGVSAMERKRHLLFSSASSFSDDNNSELFDDGLETCFCLAIFPDNNDSDKKNSSSKNNNNQVWAATCGFTKDDVNNHSSSSSSMMMKWKPDDVIGKIRGIACLSESGNQNNNNDDEATDSTINDHRHEQQRQHQRDDLFYSGREEEEEEEDEERRDANDEALDATAKPHDHVQSSSKSKRTIKTKSHQQQKPCIFLRAGNNNNNNNMMIHICIDPSSHVTTVFDAATQSFLVAFIIVGGIGSTLPPIERLHRPSSGVTVSNLLEAFSSIPFLKQNTLRIHKHQNHQADDDDEEEQQQQPMMIIEAVCDSIVFLVSFADQIILDQLEINREFHDRVQDNRVQTSLLRAFEKEQELKLLHDEQKEATRIQTRRDQQKYVPPHATKYISDDIRRKQLSQQKKSGDFAARFAAPQGGSVRNHFDPNSSRIVGVSSNTNKYSSSSSSSWQDMHLHFEEQQKIDDRTAHPSNISMQWLSSNSGGSDQENCDHRNNSNNSPTSSLSTSRARQSSPTTKTAELRRLNAISKNGDTISKIRQLRNRNHHHEYDNNYDNAGNYLRGNNNVIIEVDNHQQGKNRLRGTPSKTLDSIYDRLLLSGKNNNNRSKSSSTGINNNKKTRVASDFYRQNGNNSHRKNNNHNDIDPDSSAAEITVGVLLGLEKGRNENTAASNNYPLSPYHTHHQQHHHQQRIPPQTVMTPEGVLQSRMTPGTNTTTTSSSSTITTTTGELVEENSRLLHELVMSNLMR